MTKGSDVLRKVQSGMNSFSLTAQNCPRNEEHGNRSLTNISFANTQSASSFLSIAPYDVRRLVYEQLLLDIGDSTIWHCVSISDIAPAIRKGRRRKLILQPCVSFAGEPNYRNDDDWGYLHSCCYDALRYANSNRGDVAALSLSNLMLSCRRM
jgi:hypothetical protein